MSARSFVPLAALLTAGLFAGTALAGVDVEVTGKTASKGTIDVEGEREVYRFYAPRGAVLTFSAKAKKNGLTDLDVELEQPDEDPFDLGAQAGFSDAGTKIKGRKIVLDETGVWTLIVTGDGTGEYALKIALKPEKKRSSTEAGIAADSSTVLSFAVQPGATIKAKAKASKGSSAVPRFGTLWDGESVSSSFENEGKASTKSHAVNIDDTGAGGNVTLEVYNRGTAAGDIDVLLKIKSPRPAKTKLDLRGQGGGEETIISRNVSAADGGRLEVDDPDDPLKGLEMFIPAGALPGDTNISMASTTAATLADPANEQTAGPTIDLQPSGLVFNQPVDLWVPYDPDSLPVGANAVNDLRVLKREADGSTSVLVPLSVDTGNHVAHVQVNGFSTATPYVPAGMPNIVGRDYWLLIFELSFRPDVVNNDSRERIVDVEMGLAEFDAETPTSTDGGVTFTTLYREMSVTHDDQGNAIYQNSGDVSDGENANWSYNSDGQSINVDFGEDDATDVHVSRTGTFMLHGVEPGPDPFPAVLMDVFVEKSETPPTVADLEGTWHWFHFGVASENGNQGPAPANHELIRGAGTLSISTRNGDRFNIGVRERFDSTFDGASFESFSEGGSVSIAGSGDGIFEGSVILQTGGNDPVAIRMFPSADGNVMIGTDRDNPGQELLWFYCVRQRDESGFPNPVGEFFDIDLELELASYLHPDTGGTIGDFEVANFRNFLTFDGVTAFGTGSFDLFEDQANQIYRDPGVENSGVRVNVDSGFEDSQSFSVGSNGAVSFEFVEDNQRERFKGALSPAGDFITVVADPGTKSSNSSPIHLFFLSILLPPEQQMN